MPEAEQRPPERERQKISNPEILSPKEDVPFAHEPEQEAADLEFPAPLLETAVPAAEPPTMKESLKRVLSEKLSWALDVLKNKPDSDPADINDAQITQKKEETKINE